MMDKGKRLIVIRARFPLDISEAAIDEIILSLLSLSGGERRMEVFRQIRLPRDIQWLIFPDDELLSDDDPESDRLISALREYCSVDRTIWKSCKTKEKK